MIRSRHPMEHAQKRALQGTNRISGLGLRSLRLPPYTPALFLARCAAIFVTYPAQKGMGWSEVRVRGAELEDEFVCVSIVRQSVREVVAG
jgi:hypothetical protein